MPIAEAYSRRDCMVFSGNAVPGGTTDEDTTKTMISVIKEKLKITLSEADISTAHRLGPKPVGAEGSDRYPQNNCEVHTPRYKTFIIPTQLLNKIGVELPNCMPVIA